MNSDNQGQSTGIPAPDKDEWQPLMGQDLVLKTLTPAPDTAEDVGVHDVVRIRFTGRAAPTLADALDPHGPIFHCTDDDDDDDAGTENDNDRNKESKLWWVEVGGSKGVDVVPAVEMAVRFMKVGETAVVWSHSKYAYGLAGRTVTKAAHVALAPETNVAYQITVVDKVPMGADGGDSAINNNNNNPLPPLIALAQARKAQAKDMYEHEWADGAGRGRILQAYQRIASDMEPLLQQPADHVEGEGKNDDDGSSHLIATARKLRIDALNNISAVWLRAKQYKQAKEAAVAVLQMDARNFKALTRAAKAALLDPSSDFEEVQAALQAAAAEAQGDELAADVEKLQNLFVRRKQVYEQKSKQMFRKAFANNTTSNNDSTSDAVPTTGAADQSDAPTTETTNKTSNKGDDSQSKETSDVGSAHCSEAVTQNESSTAASTESPWQAWMRQYGWAYAFQIGLFLSMLAFVVYQQQNAPLTEQNHPAMPSDAVEDEF